MKLMMVFLVVLGAIQANAESRCEEVSDLALRNGNKVLVLAFEGFNQYNEALVQQIYDYQASGRGEPPSLGDSGILTGGLLSPLVRAYAHRFELVIMDNNSYQDGADCVALWLRAARGRKVLIVGHSMGAGTASSTANTIVSSGLTVDSVITVDGFGAGNLSRPSNGVIYWANYYQQNEFFMKGPSVPAARPDKQITDPAINHWNITGATEVVQGVSQRLGRIL